MGRSLGGWEPGGLKSLPDRTKDRASVLGVTIATDRDVPQLCDFQEKQT